MTVIKPNLDTYKPNQRVNQSQQPSPEPSTSPSNTFRHTTYSILQRPFLEQINEQDQAKSPKPPPRRIKRGNPGWMSPIRRHRSNYTSSRARPSSLPLPEQKSLPQQPKYQSIPGKPVAFSQAELQQLHRQLLQLSQQQQQQQQQLQQQHQLGRRPLRLRQVYSEPDLYSNDMEMVVTEDRSRIVGPSTSIVSVQYQQDLNPTADNSIDNTSNIPNTKDVADNSVDTQMEQELEEVRKAIADASDKFYDAAQKLQRAKEREEAIIFEHERRGLGGLPMTASEEGSIADHPSLFSKDSSRAPSIYEPYPLFPQANQQISIQNIQHIHEQQYLHVRPSRLPIHRTLPSSMLAREFVMTPERRHSPMQIVQSTPLANNHQRSPTRVPQLSDATSGRESSLLNDQYARQLDLAQGSVHKDDVGYQGNSESDSVHGSKPPSPQVERAVHNIGNSKLQQRKGSPQVKVKSEERDCPLSTPTTSRYPNNYRDFSIPIEIPSSETDVGTDTGEPRFHKSPTKTIRAGPNRSRSARWRSPTPIPIKRNSKQKQKAQQPKPEETSGYSSSSSHKPGVNITRSTRSPTPRSRPYPPQSPGRASSSSPRSQNAGQSHGQQSRSNESQIPNQEYLRTGSPSASVHHLRLSEFLNSINQHPYLQNQATGPPIILYTNIERVENFHNYRTTLSNRCPQSSNVVQHEGSIYSVVDGGREDDDGGEGSMEEDEDGQHGSEVGSDKMEDGTVLG